MYQNRAAGYTFAIREANTVFSFGGMTAVLCSLQNDNQLLYGNRKMMILTRKRCYTLLLSTSERIASYMPNSATQGQRIFQISQNR